MVAGFGGPWGRSSSGDVSGLGGNVQKMRHANTYLEGSQGLDWHGAPTTCKTALARVWLEQEILKDRICYENVHAYDQQSIENHTARALKVAGGGCSIGSANAYQSDLVVTGAAWYSNWKPW